MGIMVDIDSVQRRIMAEYAELARSDRPEIREVARAVLDGSRPRDLMNSAAYAEFFHEGLARLEALSDEEREELLAFDGTMEEMFGQDASSAGDAAAEGAVAAPDEDDEEYFSEHTILR